MSCKQCSNCCDCGNHGNVRIYDKGLRFAQLYASEVQNAENGKEAIPPVESEKIRIFGWIVGQLLDQIARQAKTTNVKLEFFVLSQGASSKAPPCLEPCLETRFRQSYQPHYVLTEKQLLEVMDNLSKESSFKMERINTDRKVVACYRVTLA